MIARSHLSRFFVWLPLASLSLACSAGETNDGTTSSSAGGGGAGGGATATVGTGGGFTTSSGSASSGGSTGVGGVDQCVSKTVVGEKVPLDMVIMQDRSGSMTTAKWTAAVDGIKAFADNPGAAGLGVGLGYFPAKTGSECTAAYANLEVDIAPLPANAYPIKSSLLSTSPSGGTPMRPALAGAYDAMRAFLMTNPTHEGVVILVTDGDPTGCTSNTVSAVAGDAADALAGTPSIRTFVVGMTGASFSSLDDIADAGGTTSAFDAGDGAGLIDGLEAARQQGISCEYILPVPSASEGTLDTESVLVQFVPGINETPESVPKVASAADCGELSGGFYYDDPVNPTRILLCPASCELVQGGTDNAYVNVVLGCIEPPPS